MANPSQQADELDDFNEFEPVDAPADSLEARIDEISAWWLKHAAAAVARTAPKAVEYGADDLDIMGGGLTLLANVPEGVMSSGDLRQFGQYAACAFYAMGKISRIISAVKQGRLPGPDSEFDLEVYAVMMARIREKGSWT